MDPFTQRMLEKAEQRSRTLGISNASKFPLTECSSVGSGCRAANIDDSVPSSVMASPQKQIQQKPLHSPSISNKAVVLEKATLEASPSKPLHHFAAVNKENMDLGIEINITTDKPIGVQVEIQEQDVTDSDSGDDNKTVGKEPINQPLARIRDTSRNRLQRLGALYSNTDDLSSPIHRTEAQFHAGNEDYTDISSIPKKPIQRLGKLAALADTINQWEDDTAHHEVQRGLNDTPPPKPDLPSRSALQKKNFNETHPAPKPTYSNASETDSVNQKTKQLKWDPKVISSLEAQGFQRRESSTIKHTYDFTKGPNDKAEGRKFEKDQLIGKPNIPDKKVTISQVAKTFSGAEDKIPDKTVQLNVKSGLVSGRAAIFENKANANQQQIMPARPQKDPCELSLKERMKLFESGGAKAVLPKAPITAAPTRQEFISVKPDECKENTVSNTVAPALVKLKTESKVRDKVAALVANAQSSAESRIKNIDRQRQEDMQIITNRFNKQKELFSLQQKPEVDSNEDKVTNALTANKVMRPMPPPPPPPVTSLCNLNASKRRSPGDCIDSIDEETKRARKSNQTAANRLYPALSDFESSDDNCCATVTASVTDDTQQEEQESYMEDSDVSESIQEGDNDEQQTEDSTADMCNVSLGREIMQVVQNNEARQHPHQNKKAVRYAEKDYYFDNDGHDSSMNSSSVASVGIDDYLDEALEDNEDDDEGDKYDDDDYTHDDSEIENTSRLSRGSKDTTASNSFSFRKTPGQYGTCQTIHENHEVDLHTPVMSITQPVKSELSVNQDNDNLVTLVHTVSFYRRQQSANSANSTPIRKICREQQVLRTELDGGGAKHRLEYDSPQLSDKTAADVHSDEEEEQTACLTNEAAQVQDKIKRLLDEVCKQQQVIGQTSQALNLCAATIEFSGSTESVEGERYLLLATHRRQACLDEVQRLRVENSLRPLGAPREKGLLTVNEITIPLRQEYVRKMAAGTITGHHLVCLLKYNEHVLATKTVPTMPGLLSVKFPDVLKLANVYADFRITLEIYGMLAQRDQLPHELKYHINVKDKKSGIKTPKKKGSENRLVMPPVQSPAGPNAVRTPQLVQYGFAIFSLREIQRTTWSLTQVLGVSPLEGVVHMKVNCELSVSVEYKGFLTMFEDISGFGAWHRRWCYLNGSVLSYWKYPDDEKKKTPMGSVDLNACISSKVTTAPRDICARLNTMLLECQRLAKDTDEESLIIVPNGRTTIVRHLLSADTKEERDEWCAHFNKALTLLRAWGHSN